MLKWVSKWEGAEVPKTGLFLICLLLVAPGFIVHSLDTILAPFWASLDVFLWSFAVPGYDFGTLGFNENASSHHPGWVLSCPIWKFLGIILRPLGPSINCFEV